MYVQQGGGSRGHLCAAGVMGTVATYVLYSKVGGPRGHLCSAMVGGVLSGHLCTAKLADPGATYVQQWLVVCSGTTYVQHSWWAQGPLMFSRGWRAQYHLCSAGVGGLNTTYVQQRFRTQGPLMFSSVGGPRSPLDAAGVGM
jgi:hypothetical protein